jgi:hypothetical protein
MRISIVPQSVTVNQHPGVVFKALVGKPPMMETAAVWLEEAMTPVLRTFLDQAIKVSAATRELVSRHDSK